MNALVFAWLQRLNKMATFREFFIIQCRSDGRFLTSELGFSRLVREAGKLHNVDEALETAFQNLEGDYVLFSAFEKVGDLH